MGLSKNVPIPVSGPLLLPTDVTSEQAIAALMDRAVEECGQLDILVTSAGGAAFGPIMESRTEDWDMLMNVNLRGTYLCCKSALKHMLPRKSGHILNVLSIASHMILPGSTAYTASKFGALGLTKVLAAEVRSEGIKVTAVIPGAVDTPLWDKSGGDLDRTKMLSPDDVADAMLSVIAQPGRYPYRRAPPHATPRRAVVPGGMNCSIPWSWILNPSRRENRCAGNL